MPEDQTTRLRRSSQVVVRELGFLDPTCGDAGMPFSHWHAMMEIEAGVASQAELAERLRLDKSSTSRVVDRLLERGWISVRVSRGDARRRQLTLTAAGKKKASASHGAAGARVDAALALLSAQDREALLRSMEQYGEALRRSRLRGRLRVRPIEPRDDAAVARVIRAVMPEFGASGPGFAIHDAEVDAMSASYRRPRSAYFVIVDDHDAVVGGGGVAPLEGGDGKTCELRKMYLLPATRGLGLGEVLLERCLAAAKRAGFKRCYLETLSQMTKARELYRRHGFEPLQKPMGNTGHHGCNLWFLKRL